MVQREARCYSTGLDLFNVGCTFIGLEYIIALKNVTFGYSNHTSDECEATDGTIEGKMVYLVERCTSDFPFNALLLSR